MTYQVATAVFESEYVVKKSRFIARVVPVASRSQVLEAVDRARADYSDARHHCWAYLLGHPGDGSSAGMSDDGEPSGTAGKPILNVIQHGEIGDVLVVVIRYFGGIKLGAGGLVRAYSTATQQVLELVPRARRQLWQEYRVYGGFDKEQPLRHWLETVGGKLANVEYGERLVFSLYLPTGLERAMAEFCATRQMEVKKI